MTSDGGIVYDEADDNTKDFLEDWPSICNEYVHHYRNNEIKCHKFSIMHLKNKIMSYLCKITVVYHSEGVKLGEDPQTGVVNQTVFWGINLLQDFKCLYPCKVNVTCDMPKIDIQNDI